MILSLRRHGALVYLNVLTFIILMAAFSINATSAEAQSGKSVLERSEAAIGQEVGNYRLLNQDGEFVAFQSLRGKPVLLSFIYTNCPGPCILISQNMKKLRERIDKSIVDKTLFLSVSMDPLNDSPKVLKEFGEEFVDNFDGWMFTKADMDTIEMMSRDLGFSFEKTRGGIEHMNRLTLIGPDGKTAAHFYGTEFDPVAVGAALDDSISGRSVGVKLSQALDWALVYCSNYDPVTKTYKLDFMFIATVIVQYLMLMGTILFLYRKKILSIINNYFGRGETSVN